MQGVGFVFGGPKGLVNPIGDLKKHIAPHMIEMVKAEPSSTGAARAAARPGRAAHPRRDRRAHICSNSSASSRSSSAASASTSAFRPSSTSTYGGADGDRVRLTFLLVSVGFQCIHVFQPFPGEGKFTPWIGLAINVVIVAPLIIVDVLGAFGQLG